MDTGQERIPDTGSLSGILSARDAAAALGLNERTIRRAIARGELVAVKSGRAYRITPAALHTYQARHLGRSPPATAEVRARADTTRERPLLRLAPAPLVRPPPLPQPLTSLVGRQREVAAVIDLLRDPSVRLLVLTGPGGVGKTRLALAVAAHVSHAFAAGIAFIPLAAVRDPRLVTSAVAQALGLREVAGRPLLDALMRSLREQELLLVLDNFEHLLPAATLVGALLKACPRMTVLVTSRARLNLAGERDVPVLPLALPETGVDVAELGQAEAVTLFVERARAVAPDFALTAIDAPVVAQICRRLDGLPLAIELAAAQTRLLPPAALLQRLESRLPLLVDGPRDLPARLRTMRDAIAWSYELLLPAERAAFRRLAVFVGGFTLEAAEAVGGEGSVTALDGIAALLDKSLLRLEKQPDGQARYVMLETVREYALDQLAASGDADETRCRHAAWCVAFAERAYSTMRSASDAWMARLAADHDNLRAALEWAAEHGEPETGLRLGGALWWFWFTSGHLGEGRDRLCRALATTGSEDVAPAIRAGALTGLGYLAVYQGDFARASAPLDEALALWRRLEDRFREAMLLQRLGTLAEYQGDDDQATLRYEEALALFRALGAAREVANMLENLADAAYRRGELTRSEALSSEALAIARTVPEATTLTMVLVGAARVASARGEHPAAAGLLAESLARAKEAGYWIGWADTLGGSAAVAVATGQAMTAARLLAAAMAVFEEFGIPRPFHHEQYRRSLAAVQMQLMDAEFAAAWAAGQALTREQVQTEVEQALHVACSTASADAAASPAERLGLTPREHDVLRLLVAGQTDPQIAETLSISPRTVEVHVGHILGKLGVSSRAAAAAHAVRDDLV